MVPAIKPTTGTKLFFRVKTPLGIQVAAAVAVAADLFIRSTRGARINPTDLIADDVFVISHGRKLISVLVSLPAVFSSFQKFFNKS